MAIEYHTGAILYPVVVLQHMSKHIFPLRQTGAAIGGTQY